MVSRIEQEVSVGQAALTMAIGIVIERARQLDAQDRQELCDLIGSLTSDSSEEETEAVRVAVHEILEQATSGVSTMTWSAGERPERLQKWIDHVAARVGQLRNAAGLTQIQLAERSGLPHSHISRIESARLSPSRMALEKIAAALGCDLPEIDRTSQAVDVQDSG